MLSENDRLNIGQIHYRVDNGKLSIGELLGHLLDGRAEVKADGHDGRSTLLRQTTQTLSTLLFVLGLKFTYRNAMVGIEWLDTVAEHRLVE